MVQVDLKDIIVSPLEEIEVPGGNVLHALKNTSNSYKNFGEAYFSKINYMSIKGWKFHQKMLLNLIVPIGSVKFVFTDGQGNFREEKIGEHNYCRLSVPSEVWFAFQGLEKQNLILNVSNILHDDNEVLKEDLSKYTYNWE